MTRVAATAIVAACAIAVAALVLTSTRPSYKFAAIFDTADGIVGGSQVEISGATVGSVESVQLAPGPKARIVMEVDRKYAPFHADASCTILPQGLISENYVQCGPGSVSSPVLARGPADVPTVPLSHTTIPVSAQQFLNVFTMPTDERIQVMLDELGITVAGRGQALNALLLRSNPALTETGRMLAILDHQRAQLADGIVQTNRVLDALANQQHGVRVFVDRVASVSTASAAHADALSAQVARLPPLLRALNPGLEAIDRTAVSGLPILRGVQAAGPALTRLTEILPPFLRAGQRSLPGLAEIAQVALPTLRDAGPLVLHLRRAAAATVPFAGAMNTFLISSRNAGALEGFLRIFYGFAVDDNAYDQVSHIGSSLVTVYPQCLGNPAATGCEATFSAPGQGTIPANDPGCGPVSIAPWAPETNCVGLESLPPYGGTRQAASSRVPPSRRDRVGPAKTTSSNPAVEPPKDQSPTQPTSPVPTTPTLPGLLNQLLSYLLGR